MKGKGMRNQGNSSWSNVEKHQVIKLTYGTGIWWNLSAPYPKSQKNETKNKFYILNNQSYSRISECKV